MISKVLTLTLKYSYHKSNFYTLIIAIAALDSFSLQAKRNLWFCSRYFCTELFKGTQNSLIGLNNDLLLTACLTGFSVSFV